MVLHGTGKTGENRMFKLYIIGNGFDLKHNIPSRYSDFAKFVKGIDLELYQRMERFYPNLSIDGLWSNFEEALGMPDYKELIEDYELLKKKDMANRDEYLGVNPLALSDTLGKWIFALTEHISGCLNEKKYQLDTNSLFMSFNYTRTLESLYNIEENKICYIHEVVPKDGISKEMFTGYVFGHDREYSEYDIDTILKTKKSINEDLEVKLQNAVKYYQKEIQYPKYNDFFGKIKHPTITDIVTLGHSLAKVDHPYFTQLKNDYPNAKWHIGYFDQEDKIKKIHYCSELELINIDFFNDK